MVGALDSTSSSLDLSPGWGHCVVFLRNTLYSHSASLYPFILMDTDNFFFELSLPWTSVPSRGVQILLVTL